MPPQSQNAGSTAPYWIQEQPYSIQGAQQPVSYAPLYQANQTDSFLPFHFHGPAHVSGTRKPSPIAKHQAPLKQSTQQSHNEYVSANTAYEFLNNSYTGSDKSSHQRTVLHFPDIQEFKNYPKDEPLANWHLKPKTYPDVTKNQQIYVKFITDIVKQHHPGFGQYISRFQPGGVWDLKGQAGIPPTGHLAYYKGEVVTDAYLANNAYGHAMAVDGFTLKQALDYAEWAAFSNPKNPFQADQPEDQAAIISGWFEEYTGNPWPMGMPDPIFYKGLKINDPKKYFSLFKKFQKDPAITKLLKRSEILYKNRPTK